MTPTKTKELNEILLGINIRKKLGPQQLYRRERERESWDNGTYITLTIIDTSVRR